MVNWELSENCVATQIDESDAPHVNMGQPLTDCTNPEPTHITVSPSVNHSIGTFKQAYILCLAAITLNPW